MLLHHQVARMSRHVHAASTSTNHAASSRGTYPSSNAALLRQWFKKSQLVTREHPAAFVEVNASESSSGTSHGKIHSCSPIILLPSNPKAEHHNGQQQSQKLQKQKINSCNNLFKPQGYVRLSEIAK
ncbi:hypothetical protein PIB30_035724 [Stylosanthes scabra]|uniref:Uncharacterized protein n=1 Tax=Stylosanthes scabra TaxID=79078 RepID=A0ABU6YFM1_9FABA|nr:hypothetical protein [Stylosanthes scabra]